jgi:hypothetical protein
MPRTILLLSATPRDAAPLRADEEMREIQDALARSRCRDEFVFVSRTAVRPGDVRHALLTHRPAIVHFSGHGRGAQGLVLEDEHGHSLPVSGDSLAELLALTGQAQIECVLLNACHSQAQIDSIAQHVPFVVGMVDSVDDRASIVFASAFYEGLGSGGSIPSAHALGCNAVRMSGLAVDRVAVLVERPSDFADLTQPLDLATFEHCSDLVDGSASTTGGEAPRPEVPDANPFGAMLPILEPPRFIGRADELTKLRKLLQCGWVALMGDPKVGKTSLLHRLTHTSPGYGEILGPIDLKGIEDIEDLYEHLAGALGLARAGWRTVREALRQRKLLLMLDEIDCGPDRGLDNEHLGRLRSVVSHNPSFRVVTASRRPVKELFPDIGAGSPEYNYLQPLWLGELTEEDARLLLAHPWAPRARRFDEDTVVELLELARRHPFLLQRAAYHRYEAMSDPSFDWRAAWQHDREHLL